MQAAQGRYRSCVRLPALGWIIALLGCTTVPPDFTAAELRELENPSPSTTASVDRLMPAALAYLNMAESHALARGRELTEAERQDALAIGVINPERVRVLVTDDFPPFVDENGKQIESFRRAGGLTRGHGIFVRKRFATARWLIVHELVHVRQFELIGRTELVRRTLTESHVLRNNLIPIEREAIAVSQAYLGQPTPAYAY